ncbi:MAG: crossover junction endodeoxyribonuclease RuvC [Verrucomicrobiales bacterium]
MEIILGIDPALRRTGYGVVARDGEALKVLEFGVIENPPRLRQTECLARNHECIADIIRRHQPDACAVESVIYVQSYRTAITLGAARASAILAATLAGLTVFEYPPKRVKQAVVGRGAADKQQVAFMVRARFGLDETPLPDAADALGVALAHLQDHDPKRQLPPSSTRL